MYQFGNFGLSVAPSDQPYAMIVCAGIGDMEKETPAFEMRDSCQEAFGQSVHQLFVRDTSRTWYQREQGWSELVEAISSYLLEHTVEHVAIVGLSMGGYGALELSRALPPSVTTSLTTFNVVALSTRTQLIPIPEFETRNTELIQQVYQLRQPALWQSLHPSACYSLVFAVDELEDTLHAWYVAQRQGIQLLASPGSHNIAHRLRVEGKLTRFLQQLFSPLLHDKLVDEIGFFPPKPAHFALAMARHNGAAEADQQCLAEALPSRERPK
ncbi:hypothetical protein [Vreelandella arctica]|uniref:hypothetical protein n=1 Tax=Vreelandella arctica TaxID=3126499 RepID=UPI00300E0A4F